MTRVLKMTVQELIQELQDAIDNKSTVYFTPLQHRCATRGKIDRVVIVESGVYLSSSEQTEYLDSDASDAFGL
jgi:hypothetical protein